MTLSFLGVVFPIKSGSFGGAWVAQAGKCLTLGLGSGQDRRVVISGS